MLCNVYVHRWISKLLSIGQMFVTVCYLMNGTKFNECYDFVFYLFIWCSVSLEIVFMCMCVCVCVCMYVCVCVFVRHFSAMSTFICQTISHQWYRIFNCENILHSFSITHTSITQHTVYLSNIPTPRESSYHEWNLSITDTTGTLANLIKLTLRGWARGGPT